MLLLISSLGAWRDIVSVSCKFKFINSYILGTTPQVETVILRILIFKPFKVGDYIVVGNYEGTVRTIELLYTKLTTVDNKVVMLPNGTLSNSNIINVGAEDYRRLDIEMSIGYSSDLKLAKTLLNNIINANPAIIKDREIKVIVKSLDESCVTLETRAWVKTEDYWDTKFTLLENYKSEFDKNGIEIPFNQMDVHIIQ